MKSLNPIRFIGALKGILEGRVEIPGSLVDNQLL